MLDTVRSTLTRHGMLSLGDSVAVAVSGGPDSMALLRILELLRPELGLQLTVCHINHQLRGEDSELDEALVARYCRERELPFRSLRADVAGQAAQAGQTLEEAGRQIRYAFFAEVAGEKGKIATAHHRSDSLETFFFNAQRGTGLKGLCGIPPVRDRIIRPLTDCSREEILAFCREQNLPYRMDATNQSEDFSRNIIRNRILPEFDRLNPSARDALARTIRNLAADSSYLEEQTDRLLASARTEQGYRADVIAGAPLPLRTRAAGRLLAFFGGEVSEESIRSLCSLLAGERKGVNLPGGRHLRLQDGLVCEETVAEPSPSFPPTPLQVGQNSIFPGMTANIFIASYDIYESIKNNPRKGLTNLLDYDKIGNNPHFRPKKEGDRAAIVDRGGTKPLRKLFREAEIPHSLWPNIPVLADEEGILWIWKLGACERARIDSSTRRVLVIELTMAE